MHEAATAAAPATFAGLTGPVPRSGGASSFGAPCDLPRLGLRGADTAVSSTGIGSSWSNPAACVVGTLALSIANKGGCGSRRRAHRADQRSGRAHRIVRGPFENRNGLVWETGAARSTPTQRVVIVGGGPGGLALACALTKLSNLDVRILEGRPARESGAQRGRSHTIGLGRRAREALISVGGAALWERIKSRGMVAGGFTLHLNGVALALPAPEGEPVMLVDRGEIIAALSEHLAACPRAAGTRLTLQSSTKVCSVDLANRAVVVQREGAEESLPYDVLVGADGVRSRVREAMGSQLPPGRFESELRLMPGRWQVLHMELPPAFEADAVHALVSSEAPFGVFCIPNRCGTHCLIVSWSSQETPTELLEARTPEDLEELLLRFFPKLGAVPREAAQSFLSTSPSKAVASRCRPLHDADAAVCLMGDAAHAVGGGSLGQGCSAALQDAAALGFCLEQGAQLASVLRLAALEAARDRLQSAGLQEGAAAGEEEGGEGGAQPAQRRGWAEEAQEALASALAAYSEQRAAEGWALLDLIELQSAAEVRAGALVQGPVVMGFFIEQLGRGTLKPLAEIGSRLLTERLQTNHEASGGEVRDAGAAAWTPGVLAFLLERAVLSAWKFMFDALARLQPAMQTSLMATNEPYSQLVERNRTWLALLQSANAAAGVSKISSVRSVHVLSGLSEPDSAMWAQHFTIHERLKDDVVVRQSGATSSFFAVRSGSCRVLRNGVEAAVLGPGDSFGEVALLLGMPSPVSVVAATDVTLLAMPGDAFREVMGAGSPELRRIVVAPAERYGAGVASVEAAQKEGRQRIKSLLKGSGFAADTAAHAEGVMHVGLDELPMPRRTDLMLDQLLGTVGCEMYGQGEVVALGCHRLRVVESGTCSVVRGGRKVRQLHPGDFFGPDVASNERVVADSPEVHVCSFEEDASAGILASLLKA